MHIIFIPVFPTFFSSLKSEHFSYCFILKYFTYVAFTAIQNSGQKVCKVCNNNDLMNLQGSFGRFMDWQQCAAVMQREAVTVMPNCSGGGNI
jgi:hypothetical protein